MVGTSGAGKSTLAAALARVLDAEFLELDSVFHQADWVPLPTKEFRRRGVPWSFALAASNLCSVPVGWCCLGV